MKEKLLRLALTLLLAATVGGIIEVIALSYTAASKLLRPTRRISEVAPSDLGMPYENVTFHGENNVVIRSWFIPGYTGASIILLHGYGSNKGSILEIAEFLWNRGGLSVLIPDMRASGESGGDLITAGYYERGDVQQGVRYLQSRKDVDPDKIGVLGVSMGASIAVLAAAREEGIKAVVADSPFRSVSDLLYHSFEAIFGLPRFPFERIAVFMVERQTGLPINAIASIHEVAKISPRPLLLIHGSDDSLIPSEESLELFASAGEPKELWIVEGAGHGEAFFVDRAQYEEKVLGFFKTHLLD
ncbi:MAG: alpha/beta fold hydrolase [Dehalococcoidia bacterium]|nr:alpha/beta fold hydrolase [Dehalococcoidia bacterium]